MDMDMDIPAPDELEWIESNAFFPDDEEEEEEWMVGEDAGREQEKPTYKIKDPPADQNQIGRKRPMPEGEEEEEEGVVAILPDEARGSKRRTLEDQPEEDWLRHSPPDDPVADVPPELEEEVAPLADEKILSRFASEIEGDCMPVTGPSGERVYAKVSSGEMDGDQRKLIRDKPVNVLLNEPIISLIKRVEQEALTKALQESIGSPGHPTHSTTSIVTEQLWVEKYAPNSFMELLSDEHTNREVLLWLKQWDSCVFGSHIRATTDDVLSSLRRHSAIVQHKKTSFSKDFIKGSSFNNLSNKPSGILSGETKFNGSSEVPSRKLTASNPPEQKVLLLCGPPGLGKTTLAHVAAKHCGYGVVEINASDDRSSSTFETKILNVMEMKSVMGDSRPKCLVIDEIDGALGEGKGAVEVILKMVAAEKRPTSEREKTSPEAQSGKASSKKGHKTAKLSRPVICICNDLYAPALRPLRQVAKVHTFVQPTISRIVNRLKYICKGEGFKTSSIALSSLAEYTECDIRACLNTLQFLHKKKEALNILEVGSQVVGRKDMSRSAFDVWKEVFQKRKLKRERNSMNGISGLGDFDFMYSLISNCGEYELTMNGIYENFLHLSYHDPMMQKTVRCLDVLGISDSLLRYIMRTQQMSLFVYQPPVAITMRYLIAQVEKPNIEWPKSLQKCRMMLMERKELLKLWQNKISPSISRHLSVESFVEDVVSQFLQILAPPTLRPVALHLLSEREKDDLAQLVDTMVSYSITYKHSKPEPLLRTQPYGALSDVPLLSFDPPIEEFVNFKDYHTGHFGLSLAMKQVLLHEVEKQRILRESISRPVNHTNEYNSEKQESSMLDAQVAPAMNIATSASVDTNLSKAMSLMKNIVSTVPNLSLNVNQKFPVIGNTKDSRKPSTRSSNFFDRFKRGSKSDNSGDILKKAATTERDSRPLLFKYNEGFTNAVKRPVKIRELLL